MKKTKILTIIASFLIGFGIAYFIFHKKPVDKHMTPERGGDSDFQMHDERASIEKTFVGQLLNQDGIVKGKVSVNIEEGSITVDLVDSSESYNLVSAVSASGSRYVNDDKSVEYWEHQGEATLTINGIEQVFAVNYSD